jgi:hypothetical protein
MSLTSAAQLAALLLSLSGVHAQWSNINGSQFSSPGGGSGPFDLFHVYPLYGSPSVSQVKDYALAKDR